MLGLTASLGLMLVLANLPIFRSPHRVGWSAHSSTLPPKRIVLSEVQTASSPDNAASKQFEDAPPPTDIHPPQSKQTRTPTPFPDSQRTTAKSDTTIPSRESDIHYVTPLGPADEKPEIVGGMGALYLNIEYPKKARKRGIEGRLKLEFTVQTDGTVTDIEVVNSLHPLCDSAAVAGLRSVRFVPAKRDGTPIPIRLRLPVEFRLISVPKTVATNP